MTKGGQSGAHDDLEGLERDGRKSQDGRDIGIPMADADALQNIVKQLSFN